MTRNNELTILISKYNNDKELNNLKDVLDYLQMKPVYIFTTIKITKRKLLQIPRKDLMIILNNSHLSDSRLCFSVFSNDTIGDKPKYCLGVTVFDCVKLMRKIDLGREIIIDPNCKNSFILSQNMINYLLR